MLSNHGYSTNQGAVLYQYVKMMRQNRINSERNLFRCHFVEYIR
jgi:hypothetical protein